MNKILFKPTVAEVVAAQTTIRSLSKRVHPGTLVKQFSLLVSFHSSSGLEIRNAVSMMTFSPWSRNETPTVRMSPIPLTWQRQFCKAQFKGQEEGTTGRRDGGTVNAARNKDLDKALQICTFDLAFPKNVWAVGVFPSSARPLRSIRAPPTCTWKNIAKVDNTKMPPKY